MMEWQEVCWGDIATLEYGKSLRDYRNNSESVPVYGTNGQVGYTDQALCEHPGVIIGRKGAYRGVHYSKDPFFVIDTAYYLEPKESDKLDLKYCYYKLLTQNINRLDSGSAIPSTSRDDFYQICFELPLIKEQIKIRKVLECFDDKINNLQHQNQTLEKIAHTLFKQWFVDFNFPDENGKPYKDSGGEMVASELGEIPVGWKVVPLKRCISNLIDNRGKTPKYVDEGIPALSAKFVKGGNLINRDKFNLVSIDLFESSDKLRPDDIIMTSEAPLGELYYISEDTNFYPAQRVFAIRANPKIILPSYLYYWLGSFPGQYLIKRRGTGSTVQGIKQSELKECEVIIPEYEIMKTADDFVKVCLLKQEKNESKIQTLIRTRDTLLPKLMSGKIRVSD